MRYVCMKHGMYPEDKMQRLQAERVLEFITGDCAMYARPSDYWK